MKWFDDFPNPKNDVFFQVVMVFWLPDGQFWFHMSLPLPVGSPRATCGRDTMRTARCMQSTTSHGKKVGTSVRAGEMMRTSMKIPMKHPGTRHEKMNNIHRIYKDSDFFHFFTVRRWFQEESTFFGGSFWCQTGSLASTRTTVLLVFSQGNTFHFWSLRDGSFFFIKIQLGDQYNLPLGFQWNSMRPAVDQTPRPPVMTWRPQTFELG